MLFKEGEKQTNNFKFNQDGITLMDTAIAVSPSMSRTTVVPVLRRTLYGFGERS